MAIAKHIIELELESGERFTQLQECLRGLNTQSVEISEVETSKGMGVGGTLFLIEFAATVLTSVGAGLLSNTIYDACKGEAENGKFTVTVDGVEVSCQSVEDVEKLIALAKSKENGDPPKNETVAYFRFTDVEEKPRFVIQIVDPAKIANARRLISGDETERIHVQGKIVKETASYNPDWSYHLDPVSIDFFENAIEVCDATICFVEENLADVGGSTLPGSHWCPWTSRLVDEVAAP